MCEGTGRSDAASPPPRISGEHARDSAVPGAAWHRPCVWEVGKINSVNKRKTPPEKCATEPVCRFPPPAGPGGRAPRRHPLRPSHGPEARAGGTGGWQLARESTAV